jgi:hypothetical protein
MAAAERAVEVRVGVATAEAAKVGVDMEEAAKAVAARAGGPEATVC